MREVLQNIAIGLLAISNMYCLYLINEQNEKIYEQNNKNDFPSELLGVWQREYEGEYKLKYTEFDIYWEDGTMFSDNGAGKQFYGKWKTSENYMTQYVGGGKDKDEIYMMKYSIEDGNLIYTFSSGLKLKYEKAK